MSANSFLILTRKNKLRNLIFDLLLFTAVVVMFGFTGVDVVMISVMVISVPYLLITKRKYLIISILIALLISVVWKFIAGSYYVYSFKSLIISGVNLYPVFFWTFGLFTVHLVYDDVEDMVSRLPLLIKLLIFSALFWFGLIVVEWTAYNLFGIKNLATGSYGEVPYIHCIHAPLWMQISYFLMGPIYFTLLKLFRRVK